MNPLSYRNSTFFPSWRPSVFMPDDDDDQSSVTSGTAHSEDMVYVSVSLNNTYSMKQPNLYYFETKIMTSQA